MSEQLTATTVHGAPDGAPSSAPAGALLALHEHASRHHSRLSMLYAPPVGPRAAGVIENRHLDRAISERMDDLRQQLRSLDPWAASTRGEVERSLRYLKEDQRRIRKDWETYKRDPADPISESVVQLADEYEELLRSHRAMVAEVADFAGRMLELIAGARRPITTERRTG
jgi:hypothetical protein